MERESSIVEWFHGFSLEKIKHFPLWPFQRKKTDEVIGSKLKQNTA
jgi:hypothetical protein